MHRHLNYCLTFTALMFCICGYSQETLSDKTKHMHHHEKSKLKQVAYEFLSTWNASAELIKPASDALKEKIKENKQKGKDPEKGTEKLKLVYDEVVKADGIERSFLAETFALPMQYELKTKGEVLEPEDIYTAQYVIKFVLGVPRFNHGHLDIDNLDHMEKELKSLIEEYPDNDAHNQQIDGHIIDVFREEAGAFFDSFVTANKAQFEKDQNGNNSAVSSGLTQMNCGEKYEYLKEKGIMH